MYNKKICILGAPGVGKTSLVRRFTGGNYNADYLPTVGANIDKIRLQVDSDRLQLMLWDIQGEARCSPHFFDYLIGVSAIVYVVDGTRLDSLDIALELRRQIEDRRMVSPPSIMLFNKSDLSKTWEISPAVINNVEASGIFALLASAREGTGVNTAFSLLSRVLLGKTTMVAAWSCRAALAILEEINGLDRRRPEQGDEPLRIGIGTATDRVSIGVPGQSGL